MYVNIDVQPTASAIEIGIKILDTESGDISANEDVMWGID